MAAARRQFLHVFIILLAVAVLSSGAKLDRTYLPPSYAQTSGGNGQILETPITGFGNQHDDFTHATSRGFNQRNGVQNYPQNNNYAQNGNDFALSDKHYAQNGNILAQNDGVSSFDDFDQSRVQAALDRSASILRLDNQNDGEAYSYAYETSNGITAEEGGVARNGVRAQGGYSYTGDDGQVYSVRYTADENGFVPEGDHLPTPPPVPEEILKALEQNAKDEANGIYDDGSYNEGKYEGSQNEQQNNGAGYNYNNGNNFNAGGDFKAVNSVNGARADDDDSIVTTNALLRSNNAAPTRFGQQSGRSNFEDRNGVQKAYLPPFQQKSQFTQSGPNANYDQFQNNGFRNLANTDLKQNGVENAYLPPQPFAPNRRPNARYNSAQNNGFRNKVNSRLSNQNGVEKAYLPPQQYELNAQRTQVNGNARYNPTQNNGFRTQVENFNTQSGIAKTYLPPQQFGQRNQEASRRTNVRNEVEKAYLAPEQFGQRRNQLAAARGTASFRSPVSDGLLRSYLPPSQQATSQIKNKGFQSIGFAKRNGSNREYLPPMDQARNGFVSSAVFDSTHL